MLFLQNSHNNTHWLAYSIHEGENGRIQTLGTCGTKISKKQ